MRNNPRSIAARPGPARGATDRPPLVIGCGALARELVELTRRAGLPAMDLTCLPASLHNRPEQIPDAVEARIRRARADGYDRIFVAYADCGTGGLLDRVLEAEGVARLGGAHCYEVYAGRAAFAALADEEPGTFYLTDYLARNFDRLVVRGLGIDRHPELLPLYFGNYRRLVYLAQTEDLSLTSVAEAAASRLGLAFERRFVGLGELAPAIDGLRGARRVSVPPGPAMRPTYEPNEIAAQDSDLDAAHGDLIRPRYESTGFEPANAVFVRPTYEPDPETGESVRFIRPAYERQAGPGRAHRAVEAA